MWRFRQRPKPAKVAMLGEPHGHRNGDDRDFQEANPARFRFFFSPASVATGAVDNDGDVLPDATGARGLSAFLETLARTVLRRVPAWSFALWSQRHRRRGGGLAESAQGNVPLWFARSRRTAQAAALADRGGADSVSAAVLFSARAANLVLVRADAGGGGDLQRAAHRVEEPSAVRRAHSGERSVGVCAEQLAE